MTYNVFSGTLNLNQSIKWGGTFVHGARNAQMWQQHRTAFTTVCKDEFSTTTQTCSIRGCWLPSLRTSPLFACVKLYAVPRGQGFDSWPYSSDSRQVLTHMCFYQQEYKSWQLISLAKLDSTFSYVKKLYICIVYSLLDICYLHIFLNSVT